MLKQLIDWIILHGGLYMLLVVIFAETGLFVGFFLPGDSLLFAAGIYLKNLSAEFFNVHYTVVIFIITIASILGNMVGYWFGDKYGHKLYQRKDSLLFKKKHLQKAHDFYEKYGRATVFLSKFLPVIRTFVPIVAGTVDMPRKTFMVYNVLGSFVWVFSMMLGGYFLQSFVEEKYHFSLKDHIEVITIGIILVTTLPVLYKLFFSKKPLLNNEQ
jgi:membrane-associated protein